MRTNKKFSNNTFTKRVDHVQPALQPHNAPKEPQVCEDCHGVYLKRRWINAKEAITRLTPAELSAAHTTTCPACKLIRAGKAGGYLHLMGAYLHTHTDEIEHLLKNEARRAAEDNPLSRIIGWQQDGDAITVSTTTDHLAQRLGHALQKAFCGEVKFNFSHENKLTHVNWQREH
jgi:hypothetical protein